MNPNVLQGNQHVDDRGILKYNNNFNVSKVKRIYIIENKTTELQRGWQGHKVEQRWFSVLSGSFKVQLIKVDRWDAPTSTLPPIVYELFSETLDVLHVPSGYVSCIQALELDSKLLVMSDYRIGEIEDDYRYPLAQFNCTK